MSEACSMRWGHPACRSRRRSSRAWARLWRQLISSLSWSWTTCTCSMIRQAGTPSRHSRDTFRRARSWSGRRVCIWPRCRSGRGGQGQGRGGISGSDRLVSDYLESELLEHLSPDELRFLTRTAVCGRGPRRTPPQRRRARTRAPRPSAGRAAASHLRAPVPLDRRERRWRRRRRNPRDADRGRSGRRLRQRPQRAPTRPNFMPSRR